MEGDNSAIYSALTSMFNRNINSKYTAFTTCDVINFCFLVCTLE